MTTACITKAVCQSHRTIIQVTTGDKINGPKPLPDMVIPMAMPRRFSNQRVIRVVLTRMKTLRPTELTNPYQK